jgi:hypothetical protein
MNEKIDKLKKTREPHEYVKKTWHLMNVQKYAKDGTWPLHLKRGKDETLPTR